MANLLTVAFSKLRYNKAACRHVAPDGKFLPPEKVRVIIDADIAATGKRMQGHGVPLQQAARDFLDGNISQQEYSQTVEKFNDLMDREVVSLHLAEVCAGKGGVAQMDQAAYGFAGQRVRFHKEALRDWIEELRSTPELATGEAAGRLSFEQRIEAYSESGRGTYEWMREKEHLANGFGFYENEEDNAADHCHGPNSCPAQTAKGRVPIGGLIRIGFRSCLFKCRCRFNYFKSAV